MDTEHSTGTQHENTVCVSHISRSTTVLPRCRPTFVVSVELPLLAAQLVIKLAVELHLQHLGQHQVAGGVAHIVHQQEVGGGAEREGSVVRSETVTCFVQG